MPRPTRFTPDVAARIVDATREGATRRAAAAAGGVSESTLFAWLAEGRRDPDGEHGTFTAEIEQADAAAELHITRMWCAHFTKDWRAAAEFLARRFPREWRRQPSAEVIANTPAPDTQPVEPLDSELKRLAREVKARVDAEDKRAPS